MQHCFTRFLRPLLLVIPLVAQAHPSGANPLAVCASCHGAHEMGSRAAAYPAIAGLPAAYLRAQLKAFHDGARVNAIMNAVASDITAAQRRHLAAALAAMPVTPRALTRTKPNPIGAALAEHGAPGIPACAACHRVGNPRLSAFPRLAGQPAAYLAAQLRAWRSNRRPPGDPAVMPAIARALSPAQIAAISAYEAALPPTPTP